jgi:hypothetical protein
LHPALCGEGIPDFALRVTARQCNESLLAELAHLVGGCKTMLDYNLTIDPTTGYPTTASCLNAGNFAMFYQTPEMGSAFHALYTDDYLQSKVAHYWQTIATSFLGNKNVLGFDFLNEPFPGDMWVNNSLLLPGNADIHLLQPFYERLYAAVRQVDPTTLVFFEPVQFPDTLPLFGGLIFPVGFTSSPGGEADATSQVLSFHTYCCASGASACDRDGNPVDSLDQAASCDKYVHFFFKHLDRSLIPRFFFLACLFAFLRFFVVVIETLRSAINVLGASDITPTK